MNKVILMGRLTKNPEIKYAGKDNDMAVARYTLAVNRRYKRDGEQEADFISCVIFGKSAEFAPDFPQGSTCLVVLWILLSQLCFHVRGFHPLRPAFPKPFC